VRHLAPQRPPTAAIAQATFSALKRGQAHEVAGDRPAVDRTIENGTKRNANAASDSVVTAHVTRNF
jgi:hypothetical protein